MDARMARRMDALAAADSQSFAWMRRPRASNMIDLLRGFVIALMVLDHTRDYFHVSAYTLDPTDPARTHVWLLVTRWLTHLCAPRSIRPRFCSC
jgi:uncharacterized membrane protein